tara:strand:- start:11816 stop:12406 length:591 start_codon:yes stop_codon:yes gene_type:complete
MKQMNRIVNLTDACENLEVITVVGNGPISDDDREQISTAKCVVRFNDMKNMRSDELIHIRALRQNTLHMSKEDHAYCHLPVIENDSQFNHVKGNTLLPIFVTERNHDNKFEDLSFFLNCKNGTTHMDSNTAHGPSTGGAVLDFFNNISKVKRIDVYGMNWNSNVHHIDFKHKNIVHDCCNKCHIHSTLNNDYIEKT